MRGARRSRSISEPSLTARKRSLTPGRWMNTDSGSSARREVNRLLDGNPAVALTGPRQVGKTTLAHQIVRERGAIYLDLERPRDLARITDIEQYCEINADKLLVLDEVHCSPGLFAPPRGIIDMRRRSGRRTGQFLFLGSASIDLMKQSGETLAGRVAYCELHPPSVSEAGGGERLRLWHRGGFPESFLAPTDARGFDWRLDFIRTCLERDVPALGPRIPAETLRRFWTMLAHNQGQTFNAASLASSTVKVAVAPASVVASRSVVVVAGDTVTPAVSSSMMVSDAPVTVIVSELAAAWLFAAVPATVTALSGASTSLSTAVRVTVSAAFTVCPAAMTMVAPAPEATV